MQTLSGEETDWGRRTKEKELFICKKGERGRGRGWDLPKWEEREMMRGERKGVKGRKWSERKWRGQVQRQSRWRGGGEGGRERVMAERETQSGEVNVSTVVWWGVSVPMPGRFSINSFKDPVLGFSCLLSASPRPVFSLCFFPSCSASLSSVGHKSTLNHLPQFNFRFNLI